MALRYFGIDRGETIKSVTESGSTTSKDIELVVDEAAITTLNEIDIAVEVFRVYLQQDKRYR